MPSVEKAPRRVHPHRSLRHNPALAGISIYYLWLKSHTHTCNTQSQRWPVKTGSTISMKPRRSEERRVGKECRSGMSAWAYKIIENVISYARNQGIHSV